MSANRPPGPIARLAFRIWGPEFKAALAGNELRPVQLKDLAFAFTGTDGRAYYTFQDIGQLPSCRSSKVGQLLSWADAGFSRKTAEEIGNAITAQHMAALRAAANPERLARELAKATTLVEELFTRGRDVIPEDIYHEIAAALAIREDEDPAELDAVIQAQKAAMMREAGRAGVPFGILLPSFGSIIGPSLTTKDAFSALLLSWSSTEARRRAILQAIASAPASPRPGEAVKS